MGAVVKLIRNAPRATLSNSAGSRRWPCSAAPATAVGLGWQFTLAAAAYNLIRLPKLLTA